MKLYLVTAIVNDGENADFFVVAGSPRQAFELWLDEPFVEANLSPTSREEVRVWEAPILTTHAVAGVQPWPIEKSWTGCTVDDFPPHHERLHDKELAP